MNTEHPSNGRLIDLFYCEKIPKALRAGWSERTRNDPIDTVVIALKKHEPKLNKIDVLLPATTICFVLTGIILSALFKDMTYGTISTLFAVVAIGSYVAGRYKDLISGDTVRDSKNEFLEAVQKFVETIYQSKSLDAISSLNGKELEEGVKAKLDLYSSKLKDALKDKDVNNLVFWSQHLTNIFEVARLFNLVDNKDYEKYFLELISE